MKNRDQDVGVKGTICEQKEWRSPKISSYRMFVMLFYSSYFSRSLSF